MNSIQYYHTGGTFTIDELLKTASFRDITITKNVFLEFSIDNKTNHKRLFEHLTDEQKREANSFLGLLDYDASANYPVTNGVTLYIPINNVEIPIKYESNLTVTHTKNNEYFPPILRHLTNDPGYVSAELDRGNEAQQIYPKFTVWLWSRSKYLEGTGDKGFVNITKDVLSINTESSLNASSVFAITLIPVQCKWAFDVSQNKETCQPIRLDDETTQISLNRIVVNKDSAGFGAESLRNLSYYEVIANENDMIFISYEKLKIDGQPSVDDVHDKWYDLIGLIDHTTKSVLIGTNSVDITIGIRGRDLSKAIMDDNSYFNLFSRGHAGSLYGGVFGVIERYFDGQYGNISAYLNKTIQQAIEFVIARVVSVGYIPDEVASNFTATTQIVRSDDKKQKVKGIWQLIKVFIDPSIENLRVVNDSVSNPDGSIYDLFMKIAQMPFIEFIFDTYGDKFYLIFRQPPFTKKALWDIFTGFNDKDINPDFSQYKVISDQPSGGATKEQINKYKQSQVDFLTSGSEIDKRQKVSISINSDSLPETTVIFDNPINFNRVINISDKDVISDNLQNCADSYAWYKITDVGNYAGQTVSLGNFPALYFDIYAQVFGNRRLEVVSNYSDYRFFDGMNKDKNDNLYAEQASQHLAFLVETNAYLPFTRSGIITINGDRRIKKGNWIYYRPTREVFYVVSVSNTVSINGLDRTTTIHVERGMIIDYIKEKEEKITGDDGQDKIIKVSYFNIIDIDRVQKDTYDIIAGNTTNGDKFDYRKDMRVNKDVFNFFLQKRNFKITNE